MNPARLTFATAAAALVIGLTACTSTPQASAEADADAKAFVAHPAASTIYVYRSPFNHDEFDSVLYLDGRVIGSTLPGAYFRIDTVPARHVLHGTGIDVGEIALQTRPGEIYIVSLEVLAGHSNFRLVPDRLGEQHIRACCALLENWGPGQRPLIK
jgi:hypothetical protein